MEHHTLQPQRIPELEGLGTSSSHPGPSHRSPPVLSQRASFHLHGDLQGHSLSLPKKPMPVSSFHRVLSFWGRVVFQVPFFLKLLTLVPGPERRVNPWLLPSLLSSSSCSLLTSPIVLPGRACSSDLPRQQGLESHCFPLAPK